MAQLRVSAAEQAEIERIISTYELKMEAAIARIAPHLSRIARVVPQPSRDACTQLLDHYQPALRQSVTSGALARAIVEVGPELGIVLPDVNSLAVHIDDNRVPLRPETIEELERMDAIAGSAAEDIFEALTDLVVEAGEQAASSALDFRP